MSVLEKYYFAFNEYPYLLTTLTYEDEDYQMLMENAISRGKPLTREEINKFFGVKYDNVEEETSSVNVFGKKFNY